MKIGLLTLHLRITPSFSLKEKRSRLKPLLSRLHREYNISVAEIGLQDKWREAVVACVMVNNDSALIHATYQDLLKWMEKNRPDLEIVDQSIEMI